LRIPSNFYLPITQRIAYFEGESQEILRLKEKTISQNTAATRNGINVLLSKRVQLQLGKSQRPC